MKEDLEYKVIEITESGYRSVVARFTYSGDAELFVKALKKVLRKDGYNCKYKIRPKVLA